MMNSHYTINHVTTDVSNNNRNTPPLSELIKRQKLFISHLERYKIIENDKLLNAELAVVLANVETPGEFYVQINDFVEEFSNLLSGMNQFYENVEDRNYEFREFIENTPCAARYSVDGVWYRAIITGYSADTRLINVTFVDYGNKDVLTAKDVKCLCRNFFSTSAMAIRCRLANAQPISPLFNAWPKAAIEELKSLSDDRLRARFMKYEPSTSTWLIDLFTVTADGENSVLHRFLKKQYCQISSDQFSNGLPVADRNGWWSMFKPQSVLKSADYPPPNVNSNSPKPSNMLNQKAHNSSETAVVKNIVKLFEFKPSITTVNNFPVLKFDACRNSFLDVRIVHVDSTTPFLFSAILSQHANFFDEINVKLNRACSDEHRKVMVNPKPDDICAGKLPNKPQWYRCLIIERISRVVLKVYLVDYGRLEFISIADVAFLVDKFKQLFPLAIPCCLANADRINDQKTLINYLISCLNSKSSMVLRLEGTTIDNDRFIGSLFDKLEKNILDFVSVQRNNYFDVV